MNSNSELREKYYNEKKKKEQELVKLQTENKYEIKYNKIKNESKEDELKSDKINEIDIIKLENKTQLEQIKINNKYDIDLKILEIENEKEKLKKIIELKKIEKDKILKELDTKEKITKINNLSEEILREEEIKHLKIIAEADLKSKKVDMDSKENYERRKNELELEKIKQNNKFEEESKIIANSGEIKMQKIEQEKYLKLKKQNNDRQTKEMILDIFEQIFQTNK